MKHRIVYYYDRVSWYCQKHEIEIPNDNDLVLIRIGDCKNPILVKGRFMKV